MPDVNDDSRGPYAAAIADRDPHIAGAVDPDRLLGRMPGRSVRGRRWNRLPVERDGRIAAGGVRWIGCVCGLVCCAAIVNEDVNLRRIAWCVYHILRIACRVQAPRLTR